MQQHQLNPFITSFLQLLDAEEQLLREAIVVASDLYEVLRLGDLAPIKKTQPRQEQLAASLRSVADRREAAAGRLGRVIGLKSEGLTLSALANRLDEPHATNVLAARDRLTAVTNQLANFQQRNANLIHHLRSYFRSVLSALTRAPEVPVRYGASGARLNPAFGSAIQARG